MSAPGLSTAATEASVRQLIANAKSKVAGEAAKELHKAQPTPASEALLMDAYAARIQSLFDQNLAVEATALQELVRDGADLESLKRLTVEAWQLRQAARQALNAGDPRRAIALATQAQSIQATESGDALLLLSAWLKTA